MKVPSGQTASRGADEFAGTFSQQGSSSKANGARTRQRASLSEQDLEARRKKHADAERNRSHRKEVRII